MLTDSILINNWSKQSACTSLWRCRQKVVSNINLFLLSCLRSGFFSPRRFCPRVLKFCMGPSVTKRISLHPLFIFGSPPVVLLGGSMDLARTSNYGNAHGDSNTKIFYLCSCTMTHLSVRCLLHRHPSRLFPRVIPKVYPRLCIQNILSMTC